MAEVPDLTFHSPWWHAEHRTPVVDGKYCDRDTGEVKEDSSYREYMGPPAVDIIIHSQHADTYDCGFRAARPVPMEALLIHIMKIVETNKLKVDSIFATTYAIRVLLHHELTKARFNEIAKEMALGL